MALLTEGSIGDPDSRHLFAAAVEYSIASCGAGEPSADASRTAAGSTDTELRELAEALELVSQRLAGLDPQDRTAVTSALQASDRFKRGYDEPYLDAVGEELKRISSAVSAAAETRAAVLPASPVAPCFVSRVAAAYENCFEIKAELNPGTPFLAALRLLAAEAGIGLPDEPTALAGLIEPG